MVSERGRTMAAASSVDVSCPGSPIMTPHHSTCSTTVLILVLHAGSVLGELNVVWVRISQGLVTTAFY